YDRGGGEITRALGQDYKPADVSDSDWFLYGGEELSPKEQELITYVQEELAEGRPCIVYCRQSKEKDIQPR
ncbi:MAG TPA: hypothetical protein PLZ51_22745, partial [Aggregatilineales bacterium]|nr:hypothetical protein [Aggregatilineales bacterium]